MNEAALLQYLTETFVDAQVQTADGNHFVFVGTERNFPFVTLMTNDANDQTSNLARDGVFRLNIGVSRDTFRVLFPDDTSTPDFTALDRLMPHPVYGTMFWVCVLNPGTATWEAVRPLLAEAHDLSASRQAKRA